MSPQNFCAEEVVGAGVQALHLVAHRVAPGEHKHGCRKGAGAQFACDREAAALGQANVEDDQVGPNVQRELQPGFAVGSGQDIEAVLSQRALKHLKHFASILDNENRCPCSRRDAHGPRRDVRSRVIMPKGTHGKH